MSEPRPQPRGDGDPLGRILALGLGAIVIAAPLPFGSVTASARLALELAAFLLGALWLARTWLRAGPAVPRGAAVAAAGLLGLGLVQALPLGDGIVSRISPRAVACRDESRPSGEAAEGERELLGVSPSTLERRAALSVDPGATASALRTGAALVALLLCAAAVSACGRGKIVALALLLSAALQGLYGTLALAAGSETTRNAASSLGLAGATGTFVNKNHFAGFLAAALPCGLALAITIGRRRREARGLRERLLDSFGAEGSRTLLAGLLVAVGFAGLLLSFSRAGIAAGLVALVLTSLAAGRRGLRTRLAVILVLAALAAMPLLQIGADRLLASYGRAGEEIADAGGRGTVWRDTVSMFAAYPVVGSGFGTFSAAYPMFRSASVRYYYDHAHNDPLQFLAEGGVVGAALLVLLLLPLWKRAVFLLTGEGGALAAGFAAGLVAMALHALVDFNFHIPSNAATGAILSGMVLGIPWKERS